MSTSRLHAVLRHITATAPAQTSTLLPSTFFATRWTAGAGSHAALYGSKAARREAADAAELPRIALIGRPNVGKSTLFNRLTRRRSALVYDTPGSHVTRDYKEGAASLSDLKFTAIDTSGLEPFMSTDTIQGRATHVTRTMLAGTQAALFLVDGRAGIASQDYDVAKWLRSTYRQPIILLCSKVDHLGNMQLISNVHEATRLGLGEAIAVSAESQAGMVNLYAALQPIIDAHGQPEGADPSDSAAAAAAAATSSDKASAATREANTRSQQPKRLKSFGGWAAPVPKHEVSSSVSPDQTRAPRMQQPVPSTPPVDAALAGEWPTAASLPLITSKAAFQRASAEAVADRDRAQQLSGQPSAAAVEEDSGSEADDDEDIDESAAGLEVEDPWKGQPMKLTFMGLPNVGKSTLFNHLLGFQRSITGPEPGLTRDAVTSQFEWQGHKFELSDTAGWLRHGTYKTYDEVGGRVSGLTMLQGTAKMNYSHAVVLLINGVDANARLEEARFDAVQMMNRRELDLAGSILDEGRILVVAVNKMDQLSREQRQRVRDSLQEQINKSLASWKDCVAIIPLAAINGKGVDRMLQQLVDLHTKWSSRISTSVLNNWRYKMSIAYEGHGHNPMSSLKFIKMISTRPPTFLAHFRGRVVSKTYPRSVANSLRNSFGLDGVPVRVIPMTKSRRAEQEKRLAQVAKKESKSAGGPAASRGPRLDAVIRKPISRRPPALSE